MNQSGETTTTNSHAEGVKMRRDVKELVHQFQVNDDSVHFIYEKFKSAYHIQLAESNPKIVANLFQDATRKYEEYSMKMKSIGNDVYSLVQEQEQYLENLAGEMVPSDEENANAELQRRLEHLERENNEFNLKVKLEHMNSLYLEAENMIEKLMKPMQARTPVQVEDDIAILDNIKRQLSKALEEKAGLEADHSKLEARLRKTESELATNIMIGQQKAAMEVCWTMIDCLRTQGGVTHHDIDAVLSYGNLSVLPLTEE